MQRIKINSLLAENCVNWFGKLSAAHGVLISKVNFVLLLKIQRDKRLSKTEESLFINKE